MKHRSTLFSLLVASIAILPLIVMANENMIELDGSQESTTLQASQCTADEVVR